MEDFARYHKKMSKFTKEVMTKLIFKNGCKCFNFNILILLNFDPNIAPWVRRKKFLSNLSICTMYKMFYSGI